MTDESSPKEAVGRVKISRRRTATIANFVAIGATFVAGAATIVLPSPERVSGPLIWPFPSETETSVAERILKLHAELKEVKEDQARLRKSLIEEPTPPSVRLLAARIAAIDERQLRIERAIMRNPATALEIPLLKRDLDALRESNAQAVSNIRQNVDQVYDLSKWLLGALVVGIFSLALSNFLTRKS